jgi:predicted nuclease with TOPRIM domain
VKEGVRLREANEERERIKKDNHTLLMRNQELEMKLAAKSDELSRA